MKNAPGQEPNDYQRKDGSNHIESADFNKGLIISKLLLTPKIESVGSNGDKKVIKYPDVFDDFTNFQIDLLQSKLTYVENQNEFLTQEIERLSTSKTDEDLIKIIDQEIEQKRNEYIGFLQHKIAGNQATAQYIAEMQMKLDCFKGFSDVFYKEKYNEYIKNDLDEIINRYKKYINTFDARLNNLDQNSNPFENIGKIDLLTQELFIDKDIRDLTDTIGEKATGQLMTKTLVDAIKTKKSAQINILVENLADEKPDLLPDELLSKFKHLPYLERVKNAWQDKIESELLLQAKYFFYFHQLNKVKKVEYQLALNEIQIGEIEKFQRKNQLIKRQIENNSEEKSSKINVSIDLREMNKSEAQLKQTAGVSVLEKIKRYFRLDDLQKLAQSVQKQDIFASYCPQIIDFLKKWQMVEALKEHAEKIQKTGKQENINSLQAGKSMESKIIKPPQERTIDLTISRGEFLDLIEITLGNVKQDVVKKSTSLVNSQEFAELSRYEREVAILATKLSLHAQEDNGQLVIDQLFSK